MALYLSKTRNTDPALVRGTRVDTDWPSNPYLHGYGERIPTRYRVQYGTLHWRRVYVMQWGNAGNPYIVYGGEALFLDSSTEQRLTAHSGGTL